MLVCSDCVFVCSFFHVCSLCCGGSRPGWAAAPSPQSCGKSPDIATQRGGASSIFFKSSTLRRGRGSGYGSGQRKFHRVPHDCPRLFFFDQVQKELLAAAGIYVYPERGAPVALPEGKLYISHRVFHGLLGPAAFVCQAPWSKGWMRKTISTTWPQAACAAAVVVAATSNRAGPSDTLPHSARRRQLGG